jgi:hypothetical protein
MWACRSSAVSSLNLRLFKLTPSNPELRINPTVAVPVYWRRRGYSSISLPQVNLMIDPSGWYVFRVSASLEIAETRIRI